MILSEIERAAWFNRTGADRHPPAMACRATLDQIARDEFDRVKHIAVVVVTEHPQGGDEIHILQAGEMSELAVEGALMRAARIQAQG